MCGSCDICKSLNLADSYWMLQNVVLNLQQCGNVSKGVKAIAQ